MYSPIGWWSSLRHPLCAGFPLVATGILLAVLVQPLLAQTQPVLVKGARVRVVIPATTGQPGRYVSGTLVRLGGDTVVVATGASPADAAEYQVGAGSGLRLEQLVKGRGHPWEGLLAGVLIGAGAGALIGHASDEGCTGWCFQPIATRVGVVVGALSGALVGGLVGNSIRTKTWARVSTAGLRIALAPQALVVRIAFRPLGWRSAQ